ncbi:MAG: DegV family protein [Acidobacteriota bacterium]
MRDSFQTKIRYIDGIRYSRAVLKGCQEVISHEKELNKINVFPIPDKDTGSNLRKTFQLLSVNISFQETSLRQSSGKIAESVESSALGYSGTIFAEFFSGFAQGVKNFKKIFVKDFSQVLEKAVKRVYQSFENPVEGTALSVIKAWADYTKELASETDDFFILLQNSYKRAVSALKNTPEQLAVLKKNGVVDAGGKAFVYFLKGILDFTEKGILTSASEEFKETTQERGLKETERQEKFCVECCVRKGNLDRVNLVKELQSLGEDLIFYSSINFAKLHIRTLNPKEILSCVSKFGRISAEKTWDISKSLPFEKKRPLAVVTDTTCDIPDEYVENHDIYFVPVKFHAKNRVYTDKVDIIPEEFYDILESSPEIPKTSKPSLRDFTRVYKDLLLHYECVLSIQLSGGLSGTFQTALQAAKSVGPQKIKVRDSKNLSVGLGLVVLEGIESLKKSMSLEGIMNRLDKAIQNIEIFIGVRTMKYLIKGGRVTKAKGFLAKLFHIKPILSLDSQGSLMPVGKVRGQKKLEEEILSFVFRKIEKGRQEKAKFITAVAHVNARDSGERIKKKITQRVRKNPVMVMSASPVLGAHAGPGTIGVAVLRTE